MVKLLNINHNVKLILQPTKNIPAFNVSCEFGSGSGRANISPKYENEFQYTSIPGGSDGCADPGCYTDNIRFVVNAIKLCNEINFILTTFSYDITMEQIEAIISVSESCEQRIENNCTTNQLTGFSWWLDRNGNKLQYWHGDGDESTLGMWFLITVFV